MTTQLIIKHSEIKVPVMVYDNQTMYIDESVKHILWDLKDKIWILMAVTKNNRCKTVTELKRGYLEMESAKLDNGIYPNYIKAKFNNDFM